MQSATLASSVSKKPLQVMSARKYCLPYCVRRVTAPGLQHIAHDSCNTVTVLRCWLPARAWHVENAAVRRQDSIRAN
jgi:hypothetical protein